MTYTKKGYEASVRYKAEHIKRIPLDVQKEEYVRIKAHADARGEPVNAFIRRAIAEQMERGKEETKI